MARIVKGEKYRDVITSAALKYGMKPTAVLKFHAVVDQVLDRMNEYGFGDPPKRKGTR